MQTKLGIIEGFYGIKYSEHVRSYLMQRAAAQGYSFYIYAPKNDSALRSHWTEDYPLNFKERLRKAAKTAKAYGLDFGLGLSPLNLSTDFNQEQEIFCRRVEELCSLCAPRLFCLLFDDVKVDSENQGLKQNKIIHTLLELLPDCVQKVLICPTFYSFDPILEKLFGRCSEHYFSDFMSDLPRSVSVFWTGNQVLSERITPEDLQAAAKTVGRPVSLWDNYPVNDGKKLCEKLFLRPFSGREGLDGLCEYHAVNPMNEGLLSTLPLSSLPLIYQGKQEADIKAQYAKETYALFGSSATILRPYLEYLNRQGLQALSGRDRNRLIALCNSKRFRAAGELKDYLEGVYAFDPNCLTS